jgi:hypothetical protein
MVRAGKISRRDKRYILLNGKKELAIQNRG